MQVRTYAVLARAVEEGIAAGWRRAHKHETDPCELTILDALEAEVLSAICEVFDFDDPDRGAT